MTKDRRLLTMSWTRSGRVIFLFGLLAFRAGAQDISCPPASPAGSRNFQGKRMVRCNFSYQDLTNANFTDAVLISPYFGYANLTNANFQNARIMGDPANPAMPNDFSFANLEKTSFIGASFEGLTYFTNANLTCADFSGIDLTKRNVIFGDTQLEFNRARQDCRPTFRSATMDCEFMNDWRYMDLTQANIGACVSQLAGRDLSGAKMSNVNFEGLNLNGTTFAQAELNGANFHKASLIEADLSSASLLGATLDESNLTNASLYKAFLSNDASGGILIAASLTHAHLKNVNLSLARLTGVDLSSANFYGDNPTNTDACSTYSMSQCRGSATSGYAGFACNCASAHEAIMRDTKFPDAYLLLLC